MKKRLLLLPFALLGCLTAFAQTNEDVAHVLNNAKMAFEKNMLQDSIVIRNADGTNNYKFTTEFDANENNTMYFQFYWFRNAWQNSIRKEKKYDHKNNCVLDVYYAFNSVKNVWYGISKTEWAFGENSDKYTMRTSSVWNDVTNDWVNSLRDEIEYNTDGNKVSSASFTWNNLSQTWRNDYKQEYEYSAEGNLMYMKDYSWSIVNSVWTPNKEEKYSYEFTLDGEKLEEYILSEWVDGILVDKKKQDRKYDLQGNLISQIVYLRGDSDGVYWKIMNKREYAYNDANKRIFHAYFYWDKDLNKWVNIEIYRYEFDANNHQTSEIHSEREKDGDDWNNRKKTEWTYDVYGNEILRANFLWDSDNNVWEIITKSESVYDAFGNQLFDAHLIWNSFSEKWIYDFRQEKQADAEGKVTSTHYFECDALAGTYFEHFKQEHEYYSNGLPLYDHGYNWKNNKWEKEGITTYYYSPRKGNSIEDEAVEALQITPNPVVDGFVINGLSDAGNVQLKIVDMNGRVVKNQLVSNGGYVDCSALSSGVYVISLLDGSKVLTEKLVKR